MKLKIIISYNGSEWSTRLRRLYLNCSRCSCYANIPSSALHLMLAAVYFWPCSSLPCQRRLIVFNTHYGFLRLLMSHRRSCLRSCDLVTLRWKATCLLELCFRTEGSGSPGSENNGQQSFLNVARRREKRRRQQSRRCNARPLSDLFSIYNSKNSLSK